MVILLVSFPLLYGNGSSHMVMPCQASFHSQISEISNDVSFVSEFPVIRYVFGKNRQSLLHSEAAVQFDLDIALCISVTNFGEVGLAK